VRAIFRSPAERCYAGLALVFGVFFIFATPPFQAPDECNHYLRAYQLSELTVVGEKQNGTSGGMVPVAIYEEAHRFDGMPFHPGVKTSAATIVDRVRHSVRFGSAAMQARMFGDFPNTVRYSPAPYVPQVVAIWAARGLRLTIVESLYLSRVACFASAFLLTWLALRLLPGALAWSMAALALLPTGLFVTSMASPDAFIISVAYLTAALAVHLRTRPANSPWTMSLVVTAVICVAGLALSKVAYFLIPGALAVGAFHWMTGWPRRMVWLAAVVGVSLLLDVSWLALIESIRTPPRNDPGIDSSAQFQLVLHHPMVFVRAVQFDVSHRALRYYDSFIDTLGYLDVAPARWVTTALTALAIFFGMTRSSDELGSPFSGIERAILVTLAAVTVVATMLLQYLDWVTVGALDLRGVLQGRHYYPVAALLLLVLPRMPLPRAWHAIRPAMFVLGYATLLFATGYTLMERYYGTP